VPRYEDEPAIAALPSAAVHPLRTARAALYVTDLARAVDFHTAVAGLQLLHLDSERGLAILSGSLGQPGLGLVRRSAGPGLHHAGFEVADETELESSRGRLLAAGVVFAAEIDKPDKRSLVLRDPDGTLVEFFVTREVPAADRFSVPANADAAFAF
jgi:catechol 2,3-dioxygenase